MNITQELHRLVYEEKLTSPEAIVNALLDSKLRRSDFRPAIHNFVLRFLADQTRSARNANFEASRLVKEAQVRALAEKIKDGRFDAYVAAQRERHALLLLRTFHVPGKGLVSWGASTPDDHTAAAAYRRAISEGHERGMWMHVRVSAFLTERGLATVGDISTDADKQALAALIVS